METVNWDERKEKKRVYMATWCKEHKEERRAYQAAWYADHREHVRAYAATYIPAHRDEIRVRTAAHRDTRRIEVLAHYGGACQCCGEYRLEFLGIDHINGGGAKHRKEVGVGATFYKWLIAQGFPEGFQVLCHNCNLAKGIYGQCPHAAGE